MYLVENFQNIEKIIPFPQKKNEVQVIYEDNLESNWSWINSKMVEYRTDWLSSFIMENMKHF